MFSRAVAFTTLALPLLAVATPVELVPRQSCSTGPVQCCNSTVAVSEPMLCIDTTICSPSMCPDVWQSNSASGNLLLGLLGIVLGDITGLIGLNCSPLTVIGVGTGNACSAQAVCCTNNNVVSSLDTERAPWEDPDVLIVFAAPGWLDLHWLRPHHALISRHPRRCLRFRICVGRYGWIMGLVFCMEVSWNFTEA